MPIVRSTVLALFLLAVLGVPAGAQTNGTTPHTERVYKDQTGMALRAGVGIQGSFCYEIGLARTASVADSHHGYGGGSLYGTFAMFPAFRKHEAVIKGFRTGAELYTNGMVFGLEVSPFWSRDAHDVLISPRVGLGVPDLSVFYTYSLTTNKWALDRLGRHMVSIQVSPRIRTHDRLNKQWYWLMKRKKQPQVP